MVASSDGDLAIVATSAASAERRKALESRGVKVLMFDGPGGRTDLRRLVEWLGEEKYLSLLIEAGSMLNWSALDSGIVDKVFFYYAPKILGGMESLPMAGGTGRRRRMDAILLHGIQVHPIAEDEFAVEGYVRKAF
jgi:diaminohydroxyphosphoribosylaminopyrimidine deaminase/5-amino-6-(5-phosphoribosylamino)uracil reductase